MTWRLIALQRSFALHSAQQELTEQAEQADIEMRELREVITRTDELL